MHISARGGYRRQDLVMLELVIPRGHRLERMIRKDQHLGFCGLHSFEPKEKKDFHGPSRLTDHAKTVDICVTYHLAHADICPSDQLRRLLPLK